MPIPLQVLLPLHVPSAVLSGTFEQVPLLPPRLHARHAVVHTTLQQTPSVQKPLAHSLDMPQVWPLSFRQVPVALHVMLPVHAFVGFVSSEPTGRFEQVPFDPI
jgi:hypothetical protein